MYAEGEAWQDLRRTSVVRKCLASSRSSCGLDRGKDLLSSATDDTTSHRQVGAVLQEQIHLASSLATLIDAPEQYVST